MLEFIYFWLAKYLAGFAIFLGLILLLAGLFVIWLIRKYYIFNYSKAAKHIKFLIETNVKNNNGVAYERLAFNVTQYSGIRIFDNAIETSEPTKLNIFLYNYRKMLDKRIILYNEGLIYHKDTIYYIDLTNRVNVDEYN